MSNAELADLLGGEPEREGSFDGDLTMNVACDSCRNFAERHNELRRILRDQRVETFEIHPAYLGGGIRPESLDNLTEQQRVIIQFLREGERLLRGGILNNPVEDLVSLYMDPYTEEPALTCQCRSASYLPLRVYGLRIGSGVKLQRPNKDCLTCGGEFRAYFIGLMKVVKGKTKSSPEENKKLLDGFKTRLAKVFSASNFELRLPNNEQTTFFTGITCPRIPLHYHCGGCGGEYPALRVHEG